MKLPKNLSLDELLDILETAEDDTVILDTEKNDFSEILKFISKFELDVGSYEVHGKFLYKLYCAFSKHPLNYQTFIIRFTSIYPHHSKKGFFFVNKNITNILKLIEQTGKKDRFIRSKYNQKMINALKSFFNQYDLKSGEFWVESFILTELYNDYRERSKKPKYDTTKLTEAMGLFFETVKTKYAGFVWFKVNKKALDLFDEVRYNEYVNTRGLEWWKNLPEEVAITEANERRKNAKSAISKQNAKYRQIARKKKQQAALRKNTQH